MAFRQRVQKNHIGVHYNKCSSGDIGMTSPQLNFKNGGPCRFDIFQECVCWHDHRASLGNKLKFICILLGMYSTVGGSVFSVKWHQIKISVEKWPIVSFVKDYRTWNKKQSKHTAKNLRMSSSPIWHVFLSLNTEYLPVIWCFAIKRHLDLLQQFCNFVRVVVKCQFTCSHNLFL